MKKIDAGKRSEVKSILDEFPVWNEKRFKKLEKAIDSILIKIPVKYKFPTGASID